MNKDKDIYIYTRGVTRMIFITRNMKFDVTS